MKILKKAILYNHPSIEFYGGYNYFNHYFDTALKITYPLTEREFRMFLKSKLNILHCGHTNILPSEKYMKCLNKKTFKLIPYYITYDNFKLVVVKGFEKQDTLLKTSDTVLQIDKKMSDQTIREMKKYLYTDGNASSAVNEMIQRHFTFYLSALSEQDSFLLTIKNKSGIKDIVIKTREYLKVKNELMEMKTDTLNKYRRNKYFTGIFLNKQKNVYYLKIRSFDGIMMKKHFRQAFKSMKKNNTEYLILDLRNNPGGKITQSLNLLSYLLPKQDSLFYQKVIFNIEEKKYIRKKFEYRIIDFFLRLKNKKFYSQNTYIEKIFTKNKFHFNGKVYVLINANTFSAANLVAVYLSKRQNTIIIGSEPSGVKWGSNAVSFLRLYLPRTKIKFLIPTYRIIHNINIKDTQQLLLPLKPNISVYYHTADILLKKDKEMEAVYNDIMKTIKK